jgi:hypothetical protein
MPDGLRRTSASVLATTASLLAEGEFVRCTLSLPRPRPSRSPSVSAALRSRTFGWSNYTGPSGGYIMILRYSNTQVQW